MTLYLFSINAGMPPENPDRIYTSDSSLHLDQLCDDFGPVSLRTCINLRGYQKGDEWNARGR